MNTNNLEKYFSSNTAVEVVPQANVVINFVGDVRRIFMILVLERYPVARMILQGH